MLFFSLGPTLRRILAGKRCRHARTLEGVRIEVPGAKKHKGLMPLFDQACSLGGGRCIALPPNRFTQ
jgi:hypothetical protein